MKKLILTLALCLSSAYAADLQSHFDSLVKPSADQGEFSLKLSISKTQTTADALKEILSDLQTMEDITIETIEVEYAKDPAKKVEEAISKLGLTYDGFFCSAYKDFDDNRDYETGKCSEITRKLLLPFFSAKGLFRAKTLYVEGNNYGDLIYSSLILETQEETIVIDFDIVHEI